ncbi:MAG: amidohydrolase [Gemmataceae bacterium]
MFRCMMIVVVLAANAPAQGPVVSTFVNGKIWTGDSANPQAEAIAVANGRILAIGTNGRIQSLAGPGITPIDLQGRRVVPGFYDSHVHMLGSGLRLSQVALKDAADEAAFGKLLVEFDRKLPRDRWMLGGEWDHDRALRGALPTAELIDKYVADRPVFLRRYDGHMAVVNSRVLKMAGITAATPDPPGGVIFRKPGSREPSGLLRDNAMDLVDRLVPASSESEIAEAIRAALDEARSVGVTSVQDMDGSDSGTRRTLFRIYQQLAKNDKLTCRIDLRWPLASWKELADLGATENFGGDYLRIGGLKGFADGSLGSSTAKMFEPFDNEKDSTGVFVTPRDKMREWVAAADKAGLSVAIHAIGDRANAEVLDVFAEVAQANGPRDRRFRIEHAQHLRPQDYGRFAQLGVVASMQPYHIIDDGRWAEGRIGRVRCSSSYALGSLLAAKAPLAFGSDWSVAPLSPLLGIDAAVNRRTLDGKHPGGWFPEQKIGVVDALRAYTFGSAWAAGQERDRGTLATGRLADFVVLSHDILDSSVRDALAGATVRMTVVGGRVVFQRSE